MKLKLEIDIDWINEDSSVDDSIKDEVIASIVNKIQKGIEKDAAIKVNNIIDSAVVDKVNELTENMFNDFINREINISDGYGDTIKCYPSLNHLIKERFDNFMVQRVDRDGKVDNGRYNNGTPRVDYIISGQIKKFADEFTKNAVDQVSKEIKAYVSEGIKDKLGAELMTVLKVDKMLSIDKK